MSRDLTPREMVFLDREYHFKSEKLTLVSQPDGEGTVLYDPESPECREFPWLAYLLTGFHELYKYALSDASLHSKLVETERELSEIIAEDINNKGKLSSERSETIVKWYAGALDPSFYYSEQNTQMFVKWLRDKS